MKFGELETGPARENYNLAVDDIFSATVRASAEVLMSASPKAKSCVAETKEGRKS